MYFVFCFLALYFSLPRSSSPPIAAPPPLSLSLSLSLLLSPSLPPHSLNTKTLQFSVTSWNSPTALASSTTSPPTSACTPCSSGYRAASPARTVSCRSVGFPFSLSLDHMFVFCPQGLLSFVFYALRYCDHIFYARYLTAMYLSVRHSSIILP